MDNNLNLNFKNLKGIFSSNAFERRTSMPRHATSCRRNKNVVWLSLNLPEAYFTRESVFFWLPGAFADGGGTKGAS
jgi:hypothetical protein